MDTKPSKNNPFAVKPYDWEHIPLKPKEVSVFKVVLRLFAVVFILALLLAIAGAGFWLSDLGILDLKNYKLNAITQYQHQDNSVVFDRNGAKIGEFFQHYQVYVAYEKLPQDFINAIIAIEDRNFFEHIGIDPKAMVRALYMYFKTGTYKQGASTLTQQLVRYFVLTREKTIQRKFKEIVMAMKLEQQISKQEILELYANVMFLGNGSYGIGAAAQRYFGKPLDQLTTHEIALIAGLFQSPSRYNPMKYPKRAKVRQRQVLYAMAHAGFMTMDQAKTYMEEPLRYQTYSPLNIQKAPYFVEHIREQTFKLLGGKVENAGLRIYTTLDSNLQELAQQTIASSADIFALAEANLQTKNFQQGKKATVEGAIIASDPQTGEILAMVGGRDFFTSQFNRTVNSLRSPGSAFKPIVYSLGLTRGWKWSDIIYVDPVSIDNYRPRNYSDVNLTETTLLRAFYKSLNTPTVELGEELGIDAIINHARNLGIRSPMKQEIGTLLGSSEVTMLDLARVYGVFANKGSRIDTISITKILDHEGKLLYEAPPLSQRTHRVVTQQIAHLMTEGMQAVLRYGTASQSADLAHIAAGKTGTSNNSEDNWFCGYTTNLVAISWVGTDNHDALAGYSAGATLALPLWKKFISQAIQIRKPPPFLAPPGIVIAKIHPQFGHRHPQGIEMSFLEGNTPSKTHSDLETLDTQGSYRNIFNQ